MLCSDLENLLYKQAYLMREIRQCKDLSTPSLDQLEAELGGPIGLHTYTDASAFNATHSQALQTCSSESEARKEMQTHLLQLNLKYQLAVDKLDKKRKFLDELPTRMCVVKAATTDLQNQFQAFAPPPASSTMPPPATTSISATTAST